MENKIICGECYDTFNVGCSVTEVIHFPCRMVYVDDLLLSCNKCGCNHNILIFGQQYIGAPFFDFSKFDEYKTNKLVYENDSLWYDKQIRNARSEFEKQCLIRDKETYLKLFDKSLHN